MKLTPVEPWLTPRDVMELLDVGKSTVYRALEGDFLGHYRIASRYRIPVSAYERWVDAGAPTHEMNR